MKAGVAQLRWSEEFVFRLMMMEPGGVGSRNNRYTHIYYFIIVYDWNIKNIYIHSD